jgi:hypothetical protein
VRREYYTLGPLLGELAEAAINAKTLCAGASKAAAGNAAAGRGSRVV